MNALIERLSSRDRSILLWALPAIALLALLLVGQHLLGERRQAVAQLDLALEDIAWLQAHQDSLAAPRDCRPVAWSTDLPERLAARHGVRVSAAAAGGTLELSLASSHGNAVLTWLRELECQGARLESLALKTLDGQGAVSGRVVMYPPVT